MRLLLVALLAAPLRAQTDPAREELGARALSILHRAMVSDESEVRALAAEQWGPIGNPAAVPVLKRALKDGNAYVRIAAAASLHELGDLSGVAALEEIARQAPTPPSGDEDLKPLEEMRAIARNKIRAAAIRTLASFGRPSSLGALREAKNDPHGAVRDAAAMALARMGSVEDLARFAEAASDEDPQIREQAARALGGIGTASALAYLRPLAKDAEYAVRAAAVEGLGASVTALPELSDAMNDQNELVRSKAVEAIGRLRSPSAIGHLRDALGKANNVYVQLLATEGLLAVGEDADLSPARRALSQPDADTRILAVRTLESARGQEATGLLETALEDRELKVRLRAAGALVRRLQGPPKPPPEPPKGKKKR